jgi:hypothetical protein
MAMTIEANSIRKPNKFRDNENLTRIAQYLLPQLNQIAAMGNPDPLNAFIRSMGDAMEQDVTEWLIPQMTPPQPEQPQQDPQAMPQEPMPEQMPMEEMPMEEMAPPEPMSQGGDIPPDVLAMLEGLPPEALMELSGGL